MVSGMGDKPPVCDLCGLICRAGAATLSHSGRTYHFCCNGCRQVFVMLMEQTGSDDPAGFRETPLYLKCVEMGVIPSSQEDLNSRENLPLKPDAAHLLRINHPRNPTACFP